MEKNNLHNKKLAFTVLLLIAVIAVGSVICAVSAERDIDIFNQNESNITNPINSVITNSGSLSSFDNGSIYVFTDKSKISGFRVNPSTDRFGDLTSVTVDTSDALGTQKNPYVIASTDDWETFAKQMESDSNRGRGKYFVLGADLDFKGITFRPIRLFNGTFYGMDHTIKNISCSSWLYWNGSSYVSIGATTSAAFGIFCKSTDATVTDLIVSNVSLHNFPNVEAGDMATHGPFPSALIGASYGTVSVLNCHTDGEVSETSITYSRHVRASGIIAMQRGSTFLYRCSSEISMTFNSNTSILFSGLVGQINVSGSLKCEIYDCAANVECGGSGTYNHTSIAIATNSNGTAILENVVGTIDLTSTSLIAGGAMIGTSCNTFSVSNCYADGITGATGSKKSYYAVSGSGSYQSGKSYISNVHQVNRTGGYASLYSNTGDLSASVSGQPITHTSVNDLNAAAKADVGNNLSDVIWDASKIGGIYSADSSPVHNYLYASITFCNLLSGGVTEGVGLSSNDYTYGDMLPDPSTVKSYHKFVGWTIDETGENDVFKVLPKNIVGNVTVYAVWTLTDDYVNDNIVASLNVKDSIDTIMYDSVTSITLQGEVKHTAPTTSGMINPSIKYTFKQDGRVKATNNSGELELKAVNDSGQYTYSYRITDGSEPLWFYDGVVEQTQQVTIQKCNAATAKNLKIDSTTVPYYGRSLSEIQFTLDALNGAGINIVVDSMRFESTVGKVSKGTNTQNVVIFPTDIDNYETCIVIFDMTFDSQSLMMHFNLGQISRKLSAEVEYAQPYGAAEIIYLFNQEYMKALDSGDKIYDNVKTMAPYFDNAPITPDNSGTPIYSGSYSNLTTEETIEVTFKDVAYNVTFNYNDGGATPNKVESHKYGDALMRPTDPSYNNLLFVGWYFDSTEIDGNGDSVTVNREWRFNSDGINPRDRVTGNTQLTAMWLEADSLDSITVTVNGQLEARQKIKSGDLTVKAVFSGEMDGHHVTKNVTLKWSDYENNIEYSTSDNMLHVTSGGYNITVKYSFNGNEVQDTKSIDVKPIKIDTSGLVFKDKTVIFSDPDKNEKIDPIQGVLPSQIKNVKYIYLDINGDEVNENDVKGLGIFAVRAEFETISPDYAADSLEATLSIINSSVLAKPVFKGGVIYDGTQKNIEDYLDNFLSGYMEIYGGTPKATDAGKYFVNIRLKGNSGITWDDGTTNDIMQFPWTIDKSTLIIDWNEWEFVSDGTNAYAPKVSGIADGLGAGDSVDYDNDFTYKIYDENGGEVSAATDVGSYKIVASYVGSLDNNYVLDNATKEWTFVVVPKSGMTILTIEWDNNQFKYDGNVHYPTPTVTDNKGNSYTGTQITDILTFTEGYNSHKELGTYRIIATVKDGDVYFIRSGGVFVFKIVDENGNAPSEEETQNPSGNKPTDDINGGGIDVSNIGEFLKEYWQAIASGISIILIIAFLAKTAGYESRRKKANKKIDKYENAVYAATVTGLFGWASSAWTAIACVFMGLAAASLVIMIIAKSRCSKAEDELEEAKEQYDRNKESSRRDYDDNRHSDELQDLKSILMQMMSGGNMNGMNMGQGMPQGMYMGTQQGIGPEDMRMMINETVSALLPGMQQMLPQQASANDELVKKLIEKEERNDETIKKLMEQNEKLMQDNAQNQKTMQEMMQKLAEKPAQKIVEKEVAATNANDENFKRLLEDNAKNQEIMQALIKQLANQPVQQVVASQPQIIERVVEKPVEKIVEKEVRVEVPVEKVVEEPVVHVVSTEAAGGAEKSKQVKPAPKKETAPRLTLEEAYAKLTKEQKKYFDGLREYAMKKDSKCKEKLATYFTTIGPSTTNPLIKLTIKKGVTVALFKMEDEYLKDIRRNAGSDGTKIKVKETEMPIGDAQAFDTAKDMIDLRIDQIERYNDFLKEQRAMKRK